MSGTCIFSYGPSEIASIKYLIDNDAAICCTKKTELKQSLEILLRNNEKRSTVIQNAKALAKKNHAIGVTPNTIRRELQLICGE